jgi:hypothetical protein
MHLKESNAFAKLISTIKFINNAKNKFTVTLISAKKFIKTENINLNKQAKQIEPTNI